jgi:hypothetical protein
VLDVDALLVGAVLGDRADCGHPPVSGSGVFNALDGRQKLFFREVLRRRVLVEVDLLLVNHKDRLQSRARVVNYHASELVGSWLTSKLEKNADARRRLESAVVVVVGGCDTSACGYVQRREILALRRRMLPQSRFNIEGIFLEESDQNGRLVLLISIDREAKLEGADFRCREYRACFGCVSCGWKEDGGPLIKTSRAQEDLEKEREFVGRVGGEQVSEQTRAPSRRQAADDERTNKQTAKVKSERLLLEKQYIIAAA